MLEIVSLDLCLLLMYVPMGDQFSNITVIFSADGKTPTVNSPCDVNYAGSLIDGTEFDSSFARGEPSRFSPSQVIKGWTEASEYLCNFLQWCFIVRYVLVTPTSSIYY